MPRVLVIDDQHFVRSTIALILKAQGFEVVEVDRGAEGLKKLEQNAFDLAIVDIYMPGMDGVKIIKMMRQRAPDLPIIAMSGVQLNSSDKTALDYFSMVPELSIIPCLKKPFRPKELTEAIQKVMRVTACG
jgi:CheY-like chemotaxis protein